MLQHAFVINQTSCEECGLDNYPLEDEPGKL